jgi:betaine-homocysteine S-methyltransferase
LRLQYFEHIEEMEWAIEVCKETGKTVASTMCIGPKGDIDGVPAAECAVRMARAGSNVGEQVVSISFQFFKTGPDVLRHCLS